MKILNSTSIIHARHLMYGMLDQMTHTESTKAWLGWDAQSDEKGH